jgi:hypothetical protein
MSLSGHGGAKARKHLLCLQPSLLLAALVSLSSLLRLFTAPIASRLTKCGHLNIVTAET